MSEDLAIMLVMITGILTTGGVIVLRPLSRRLADLMHAITQDRLNPGRNDTQRLHETIAALEQRLSLLEERQNFAESLLDRRLPPETSYNGSLSPPEATRRLL